MLPYNRSQDSLTSGQTDPAVPTWVVFITRTWWFSMKKTWCFYFADLLIFLELISKEGITYCSIFLQEYFVSWFSAKDFSMLLHNLVAAPTYLKFNFKLHVTLVWWCRKDSPGELIVDMDKLCVYTYVDDGTQWQYTHMVDAAKLEPHPTPPPPVSRPEGRGWNRPEAAWSAEGGQETE
jgi:hypothetical protein